MYDSFHGSGKPYLQLHNNIRISATGEKPVEAVLLHHHTQIVHLLDCADRVPFFTTEGAQRRGGCPGMKLDFNRSNLEGVGDLGDVVEAEACSNLTGMLRQLADLVDHTATVFEGLHAEVLLLLLYYIKQESWDAERDSPRYWQASGHGDEGGRGLCSSLVHASLGSPSR